jgi:type IV pilus assembly protein PilX
MKKMISPNLFSHRQRGATLLITMIFMLLISLIAVTSMTNSTQQTKLMANVERKNSTFQESESSLAQISNDDLFAMISTLETVAVNSPGTYQSYSVSTVGDTDLTPTTKLRILGPRTVVYNADFDSDSTATKSGGGMSSARITAGGGSINKHCIVEISSTSTMANSSISTTILEGRPIDSSTCQTTSD